MARDMRAAVRDSGASVDQRSVSRLFVRIPIKVDNDSGDVNNAPLERG
jgi:hypothetical protein